MCKPGCRGNDQPPTGKTLNLSSSITPESCPRPAHPMQDSPCQVWHSRLHPMKTKIILPLLMLAGALLVGCATSSDKLNNLQIGMTKDQVIALLGPPNSTSAPGPERPIPDVLPHGRHRPGPGPGPALHDSPGRQQGGVVRPVLAQLNDYYMRPINNGQSAAYGNMPMGYPAVVPRRARPRSRRANRQAEGIEGPGRPHRRGIPEGEGQAARQPVVSRSRNRSIPAGGPTGTSARSRSGRVGNRPG